MASILRAPLMSDEKRKLASRPVVPGDVLQKPSIAAATSTATHALIVAPIEAPPKSAPTAIKIDLTASQIRQEILDELSAQAKLARKAGYELGLEEGRLAGEAIAQKSATDEAARIRSIADKLHEALAADRPQAEELAIAIAFEAICKVLGDTVATQQGVQAIVREVAARLRSDARLVVRLTPEDLEMLRAADVLTSTLAQGATVAWVADRTVGLGGCVVETEGGELDARLDVQLVRLRTVLLNARTNSPSSIKVGADE
jgi:flagellar assembly protein FliH